MTLTDAGRRGAELYSRRNANPLPAFSTLGAGASAGTGSRAADTGSGVDILKTYIPGTLLALYVPVLPIAHQIQNGILDVVLLLLFTVFACVYVTRVELSAIRSDGGTPTLTTIPRFPVAATAFSFVAYSAALPMSAVSDIQRWNPLVGTLVVALAGGLLFAVGPVLENRI